MRNTITLKTYSDITIVDVEGEIGIPESEHYSDNVRLGKIAQDFRNSLNEIAGIKASTTIVNIRSTGGDVDDAMLVYKALKLLDSKVVTRCFGYCGSAATIARMATRVQINQTDRWYDDEGFELEYITHWQKIVLPKRE